MDPKTPEDLHKNYRICADHFEPSQFMNPENRNKLIHCAVPTLFNIPNPPHKLQGKRQLPFRKQTSNPQETCVKLNDCEDPLTVKTPEPVTPEPDNVETVVNTRRKRSLKRHVARLRSQLWRSEKTRKKKTRKDKKIDNVLSELSSHLPKATMEFVRTQVTMFGKSKYARRWSTKDKMFA